MEQWCCDTQRGKANDLEEACFSTHLFNTKSLREKVLDKIRIYFMPSTPFLASYGFLNNKYGECMHQNCYVIPRVTSLF